MSGQMSTRKTRRRRTVSLHDTEPINVYCYSLSGSIFHVRVVGCQHQRSALAGGVAAADVGCRSQLHCDFVLVPSTVVESR